MKNFLIITRYAKALVKIAVEENIVSDVRKNLDDFLKLIKERGDFFLWIADDEIIHSRRQALLQELGAKLKMHPTVLKFLEVLVRKERIRYIVRIARSFNEQADEKEGIVRGRIVVANHEAGEGIRGKLEALFSKKLDKTAIFTVKEDKSILGGIVLLMKDHVWDASIKRTLNEIKENVCLM